ncbi:MULTISPECIES: PIN domain-containing protein [Archaeoglobus]
MPNDAIILSTCKFYGVKYLISFDGDFKRACKEEGIKLIDGICLMMNT